MNILFFGGHYWDKGPWFRKQQFALRLSKKGHKVFYVEASISILKKKATDKNKYFKTEINQINENLNIITPSTLLPYPRNYISRKIFYIKLLNDFNKIFKERDITDYILWFNRTELSSILVKIKQPKIFDLCDDLPFYQKLAGDEKQFHISTQDLANSFEQSDHHIVSAVKLKEKYQQYTKNDIIIIPNGHDIKINQNITLDLPPILKNLKRPVVGFIGTLFRFIDDDLLEYLVSNRPDYNFVFVGGIESNFPIQKIKNFNNVFLIGKQPKDLIPSIINSFDVCINPFKVHEVNDSVNPVKVFEYLALRKKVISTLMYSLMKEKVADYILFARDKNEFIKILDDIIKEKKLSNNVPKQVIELYHWDNLFISLIENLKKQGMSL